MANIHRFLIKTIIYVFYTFMILKFPGSVQCLIIGGMTSFFRECSFFVSIGYVIRSRGFPIHLKNALILLILFKIDHLYCSSLFILYTFQLLSHSFLHILSAC